MLKHLNKEQKEAVEYVEGPVLVLAGAGSGKTRVVTCRIINLIEKGIDPSSILAVTFTNKAAQEMRERVENQTSSNVMIRTFHSLGALILRQSIDALGYDLEFTIYDEQDSLRLVKVCMQEMDIKLDKVKPKSIRNAISRVKSNLPNMIPKMLKTEEDQFFEQIYNSYQEKLKKSNALDFDDLLFLVVRLFDEHKDILKHYQNKWSFVLIDEYQDTNILQRIIAKYLVEKSNNIFVVGDPDQSIYSWRGADVSNILNFEEDYPKAQIIRLEQNYRSQNNILKAANALITNNDSRYEKKLWSNLGDGEKIFLYKSGNEIDEANFVLNKALDYHNRDNIPLREIAIFYRTNFQSRVFEDALLGSRVPYVIFGGLSFYQRREIKDILAFLHMVHSDSDIISFMRTINLPKRGFGAVTLKKMRIAAEKEGIGIFKLCQKMLMDKTCCKVSARQREGLKEYVSLIEFLRTINDLPELVKATIEKSGYLKYLEEDDRESFQDRKNNVEELISKASDRERELSMFLEELSLKSSADVASKSEDYVNLMTVHHGKGLEFQLVFLVGLEEGLFPHMNSKNSLDEIEEERRLCYVGMTRAKNLLYLTNARQRKLWGAKRSFLPSRFLNEIPREYVQGISPFRAMERTHNEETLQNNVVLDEGVSVYHKEYGEGIISRVYEDDAFGDMYEIFFPKSQSIKKMAAQYASLEVV